MTKKLGVDATKQQLVNPVDSSSLGTELIHYHTHNKPIVEAASEQLADEYLKFLDQKDESIREAIVMLARAEAAANSVIPSPGDIETYLGVILSMSKGLVWFKIFNPFGVTCIQFGIRKVNSEQEIDATVRRYKEVKFAAIKSTETDIQKRLKQTIEGINTGMRGILHVGLKPYQR